MKTSFEGWGDGGGGPWRCWHMTKVGSPERTVICSLHIPLRTCDQRGPVSPASTFCGWDWLWHSGSESLEEWMDVFPGSFRASHVAFWVSPCPPLKWTPCQSWIWVSWIGIHSNQWTITCRQWLSGFRCCFPSLTSSTPRLAQGSEGALGLPIRALPQSPFLGRPCGYNPSLSLWQEMKLWLSRLWLPCLTNRKSSNCAEICVMSISQPSLKCFAWWRQPLRHVGTCLFCQWISCCSERLSDLSGNAQLGFKLGILCL